MNCATVIWNLSINQVGLILVWYLRALMTLPLCLSWYHFPFVAPVHTKLNCIILKSQDRVDTFVNCYTFTRKYSEKRSGCKCLSSAFYDSLTKDEFYLTMFSSLVSPSCYGFKIAYYISTTQRTVKAPKDNALWDRYHVSRFTTLYGSSMLYDGVWMVIIDGSANGRNIQEARRDERDFSRWRCTFNSFQIVNVFVTACDQLFSEMDIVSDR